WAKFQILPNGDTVRTAHEARVPEEDGRDVTYVWYELDIDKNHSRQRQLVDFKEHTFFSKLENIVIVDVGPIPTALPPRLRPSTLVLAIVHQCSITEKHPTLDIHYYRRQGQTVIIDIESIYCVLGHIKV
ncbi:uncharacterized protein BXZ73DRAFT_29401, partial [Epithele typhae]|uniref:uncharacterized protein n=1 Tax=Epithele typhae TaxID=378194 RepID=UPI002008D362